MIKFTRDIDWDEILKQRIMQQDNPEYKYWYGSDHLTSTWKPERYDGWSRDIMMIVHKDKKVGLWK